MENGTEALCITLRERRSDGHDDHYFVVTLPIEEIGKLTTAIQQSLAKATVAQEIYNYLLSGQKLNAIKAHRTAYGTPLKDAKEAVELIEKLLKLQLAAHDAWERDKPNRIMGSVTGRFYHDGPNEQEIPF
jgi:hypothetical protein